MMDFFLQKKRKIQLFFDLCFLLKNRRVCVIINKDNVEIIFRYDILLLIKTKSNGLGVINMKKTKIICTLGPSSNNLETVEEDSEDDEENEKDED